MQRIEADDRYLCGPFSAAFALSREVIKNRVFIVNSFVNEFKSKYQGTIVGVIWNVLIPLLPIIVYIVLTNSRLVVGFEGLDTSVAVSFNAMVWFLFVGLVQTPIDVVESRTKDAIKTEVPLSAFVAAGVLNLTYETALRVCFFLVIFIWAGAFDIMLILVLPLIVASAVPFLAVGIFLALLNVSVSDVRKVTSSLLGLGIFLSGVIFPLPSSGPLSYFSEYNPFAFTIAFLRSGLSGGYQLDITYLTWLSVGFILFIVAGRAFYVMELRIRNVLQ